MILEITNIHNASSLFTFESDDLKQAAEIIKLEIESAQFRYNKEQFCVVPKVYKVHPKIAIKNFYAVARCYTRPPFPPAFEDVIIFTTP